MDVAAGTIAQIVQSVQHVAGIVSEITSATVEQSAGIDLVNSAITQMDQVTQQNAALVEEVAAAADSMPDVIQERKESSELLLRSIESLTPRTRRVKLRTLYSSALAHSAAVQARMHALAVKVRPTLR